MNTTTEHTEDTTQASGPDEMAAGLAALQLKAADDPGAIVPTAPATGAQVAQVEQAPPVALSVEIGDAITAGVTLLGPIFPSLGRVYTPETVQRLAVSTEAVCVKRGWLAGGLFGGRAEEVVLAAVLIPVTLSTWAAVKHDLIKARMEEKPWLGWLARVTGWGRKAKAKAVPQDRPGAAVASVGTAVEVAPA
ncbi:hypothetical protein [Aquabacterium sp.]|uniref:hypothetical protein n=1 Tax=Aquabacterium sp. TaxID=1872578 RepID=UPI0025BD3565|nr:hypothetical protein [Aquabacterium sp.]